MVGKRKGGGETESSLSEEAEEEVEVMMRCLGKSASVFARSAAARYFRHLLAKAQKETSAWPIYLPRLIPKLIACLPRTQLNTAEIQLDATWAITNILCGGEVQTHAVVFGGATELLMDLARQSYSAELRDQAVWALSNIAGDCDSCRAFLSQLSFIPLLADLIHTHIHHPQPPPESKISTLKTAVWALSNICRGKPEMSALAEVIPILPLLARIIDAPAGAFNDTVQADAVWSLAYLADGNAAHAQAVLGSGSLVSLIRIVGEGSPGGSVLRGALRAVGNLLTGADTETQAVIDSGAIPALHRLLLRGPEAHDEAIRRETVWSLSNMTAGTTGQIGRVLEEPGLLELLVGLGRRERGKVQREAGWALGNAATGGLEAQLGRLVSAGAVGSLGSCLAEQKEPRSLQGLLSACRSVMEQGRGAEWEEDAGWRLRRRLMEDAGVGDVVRRLRRRHHSRPLRVLAHHLFKNHFKPLPKPKPSRLPAFILTIYA